ncbi:hypothetical protein ABB37_07473 [Leptomonas pyrrhocoris]|uniref:Major facilitator superfamily (MFS) profile domain-containing protein n=1 Tax=Leptomonas pyrrhocoris TaxID=157538 RepID=A0A0M9FUY8_LEPPY|nr:hypothetical protein ABB37_07473 [Leptomonas pyrrhocoris]KPA76610.1 hypothetical protein ABB37_07473 [Leptomonas pyrrhocoris]|eukprot:XP_015655049.1 hypothetical protein ABB37_07473 [Leptomonas pyrrhocoris]
MPPTSRDPLPGEMHDDDSAGENNSGTAAAAGEKEGSPLREATDEGVMNGEEGAADAAAVKVSIAPAIIGYFGMMFGNGIIPFHSQILDAKGFSPYQIGILVASNPLLSMTLLPTLSYLADKFRCETKMVLTSIVISSASAFAYTMSSASYLVVIFFLVMSASRIVMNPLLDQRTLMMFPKDGRSSAWSYVRSYGAYGWGLGSLVASLIYTVTKSWVAVAAQFFVGQLGLAYCMMVVMPYEEIEKVPVRFKEVLHLLATNVRLTLFIFAVTMMGTGYSFITNFLFLFLKDLGGSKFLMGLTIVLTVSTEIPLFQMSERLHQMFTERHMMTIAMSVWTFRVVCYSLLRNPWWVLLIEPLHGVTFSFMWLPSVHLVARAFPPKLSSSATGVLFTFMSGVGPVVGNLVAGTLYSLVGPRKMFLCAAAAMGLSLVFYLAMDYTLERRGVSVVCDYDAADVTMVDIARAPMWWQVSVRSLCAKANRWRQAKRVKNLCGVHLGTETGQTADVK